ncbi:PAS domain S-box protein [Chloroflexota bacterium]
MERQINILIVDDDTGLTSNLQDILETEGYSIVVANDGQTALALYDKSVFDLILVDIRLPDMSGQELIGKLAEISPGVEYIIITGYASLDGAVDAVRQKNIVGYLTKPLNMEYLILLIRQVIERKKAEETLEEREEKYRSLVNNVALGVFRSSPEVNGSFLEVNPAMERISGYSREELLAMKVSELYVNPEEREEVLSEAASGQSTKELLFKKKDGTVITVLDVKTAIKGTDGEIQYFDGVLEDITERKQAQRELYIINQIANVFLTVPDDEMYGEVLKIILAAMESNQGVFGYIDENGAHVVPSMTREVWWNQCNVPEKAIIFPRETWGNSSWPWAIREKKTNYTNEPSTITPEGHIKILRHISMPIVYQGESIGLIQVANKETDYQTTDIALLENIGDQIAPLLDARLQRDREEKSRKLAEYDLAERVKELQCLYGIDMIGAKSEFTMNEIYEEVVKLLPQSWRYPEITGARLTLQDKKFETNNYRDTDWKQSAVIKAFGVEAGEVQIVYLEEKPELDEGPFLKEERHLITSVAEQLARITEAKQAEEQIKHLTLSLRSIRNVNQLITREKNREKLLKEACRLLTATGSYSNTWIALLDESGKLLAHAESGWGRDFLPLLEQLKLGEIPACGRQALEQASVVVADELASTCTGCPLQEDRMNGKVALTVRLEHAGKVYGLLSASMLGVFVTDEEKGLFEEAAGDIAFALHDIALEAKHNEMVISLKESEGKWRSLVENAPNSIILVDRDKKIQFINHVVTGLAAESVIGKSIFDYIQPEYHETVRKVVDKVFQTGEIGFYEIMGTGPDGSMSWYETSTGPLKHDGQITGVIQIVSDITERKQMQAQILTNDRLASIGELISGVAHELNNPLTGVIGFSDLLVGRKGLPDDVKEDLKIINKEARRTANIVKNLLTFARKQPKEKQLTDINKAIEAVIELRAYEQKVSNLEVNTRFASDLPEIISNAFDLQQVFLNIIVNAEHAMLEAYGKGTITITTVMEGDIIRVSLADDGPGISEGHIGHVFDPFFTTKEVGKGTGLGLSICHGIVTAQGGRIYVKSEQGKGATFAVELPIPARGGESNEKS